MSRHAFMMVMTCGAGLLTTASAAEGDGNQPPAPAAPAMVPAAPAAPPANGAPSGRRRFVAPANQPPAPVPDAAAEEDDIRPPRPRVEIPVPEKVSLTPWIVVGSLIVAGVLLGWWLRRRGGRTREAGMLDRALSELNAVDRERNNLAAGPLADRTADVVRRFIAARFGIAAPRRTTEEFLRDVATAPRPELDAQRDLLRGFLHACDMAKFGGADFDAADRLALVQSAWQFLQAAGSPAPEAAGQTRKEAA